MTTQHKHEGSCPAGSGSPSTRISHAKKQKLHQSKKRTRSLGDSLAWLFRTNLPPRRGAPLENEKKREWFGLGEVLEVIANPSDTLNELVETRKALRKARRDLRIRASVSSWYIPPEAYFFPSLPNIPGLSTIPLLPRRCETSALDRIFSGSPSLAILNGPPSVGKTTLLREVLKDEEKYLVLWLDLKLIGRDGIEGLLLTMASALEVFMEKIEPDDGAFDHEFEKLFRAVKYERHFLSHFRQESPSPASNANANSDPQMGLSSHDVARLIQLYRSALLMYWSSTSSHSQQTSEASTLVHAPSLSNLGVQQAEVLHPEGEPVLEQQTGLKRSKSEKLKSYSQIFHFKNFSRSHVVQSSVGHDSEEETKVDHLSSGHTHEGSGGVGEATQSQAQVQVTSEAAANMNTSTSKELREAKNTVEFATPVNEGEKPRARLNAGDGDMHTRPLQATVKHSKSASRPNFVRARMPVIVFDDAHKLLSLSISASSPSKSNEVLRTLFDGLLVLSKQDRLCQVVQATNDGLYINKLRDLGLGASGELKTVSITDPSKSQTREYFTQCLVPSVPPSLRAQLKLDDEGMKEDMFERLYEAFGGRLTHWTDFMGDWVNAGGDLTVERSTPFLHAYTTLNFLLLSASEGEAEAEAEPEDDQISIDERNARNLRPIRTNGRNRSPSPSRPRSRGVTFLPGLHSGRRGMKSSATLVAGIGPSGDAPHANTSGSDTETAEEAPPLTVMQLLDLMYSLTSPPTQPSQSREAYDRSHSIYFSRISSYYVPRQSMKAPALRRPMSTRSGKGFTAATKKGEQGVRDRETGVGISPIPYFVLCRELASRDTVDFLVRSGIVELCWGTPLPSSVPGEHRGEREPVGGTHETEADPGLGPMLLPSSPILAHAMRIVLDEYGYQAPSDDNPNPDVDLEADGETEMDPELEKPSPHRRVPDNGRNGVPQDKDQDQDVAEEADPDNEVDEDERDEFVDGEEYESYPVSPASARGGGRFYNHSPHSPRSPHSRSGHGHAGGRDSSADDQSDYVSFMDDDFGDY